MSLKQIEVKGIEVFYYDCCTKETEARQQAERDNFWNYQQRDNQDRLRGMIIDHKVNCNV